jgi:hypothetical protein
VTADELRAALRCGAPRCACARPRGPWHCPTHPDARPSFAIADRGRVLFHCRAGCLQTDVIAALKGRGLWGSPRVVLTRPALSPFEAARTEAVARERMAESRRAPHRPTWAAADAYRTSMGEVAAARAIATAAGPDAPGAWDTLALAAEAETAAEAALAEASEEGA